MVADFINRTHNAKENGQKAKSERKRKDITQRDFMKHIEHLFPILLIIFDLCAAVVYFAHKDIKKGIYWLAAATLSITVTF
jgi:hypothetical protein